MTSPLREHGTTPNIIIEGLHDFFMRVSIIRISKTYTHCQVANYPQ